MTKYCAISLCHLPIDVMMASFTQFFYIPVRIDVPSLQKSQSRLAVSAFHRISVFIAIWPDKSKCQ